MERTNATQRYPGAPSQIALGISAADSRSATPRSRPQSASTSATRPPLREDATLRLPHCISFPQHCREELFRRKRPEFIQPPNGHLNFLDHEACAEVNNDFHTATGGCGITNSGSWAAAISFSAVARAKTTSRRVHANSVAHSETE